MPWVRFKGPWPFKQLLSLCVDHPWQYALARLFFFFANSLNIEMNSAVALPFVSVVMAPSVRLRERQLWVGHITHCFSFQWLYKLFIWWEFCFWKMWLCHSRLSGANNIYLVFPSQSRFMNIADGWLSACGSPYTLTLLVLLLRPLLSFQLPKNGCLLFAVSLFFEALIKKRYKVCYIHLMHTLAFFCPFQRNHKMKCNQKC